MFKIGDQVVYPMYGAGIVTDIVERDFFGETRSFYCISLPHSKMDVSVPVGTSGTIGVREVISKTEIEEVIEVLGQDADPQCNNWNKRYRDNMEKLQTGDILKVAQVVRNLVLTDRNKPLSTGEKNLLGTAKQILESELMCAGGYEAKETDDLVEASI